MMKDDGAYLSASKAIRNRLAERDITYKNLSRLLESQGIYENEDQLRTKIHRGKFSHVFFVKVMRAIGVTAIYLEKPSITVSRPNLSPREVIHLD